MKRPSVFLAQVALSSLLTAATSVHAQASDAQAADVDHDGVVSQAEAEHSTAFRLKFDELDRNRDGRLDSTEIPADMSGPAAGANLPAAPGADLGRRGPNTAPGSGRKSAPASVPGSSVGAPPSAPPPPAAGSSGSGGGTR